MNTYTLLSTAIVTTVASQLLFKKGMLVIGDAIHVSVDGVLGLIFGIARNPYLITGIALYGASFIIWLIVLSRTKLSLIYPITSLNFVLVIVASYYLFGERLSGTQLGAIAIIIIGVVALARA